MDIAQTTCSSEQLAQLEAQIVQTTSRAELLRLGRELQCLADVAQLRWRKLERCKLAEAIKDDCSEALSLHRCQSSPESKELQQGLVVAHMYGIQEKLRTMASLHPGSQITEEMKQIREITEHFVPHSQLWRWWHRKEMASFSELERCITALVNQCQV